MPVPPFLQRLSLITGAAGIGALENAGVMVFGLGGVGSWCAEALVRSGICRLCLVDSDTVCVTNINRQAQATVRTIGCLKTTALRERLLEINPAAQIETVSKVYSRENEAFFPFAEYAYVIDAIDSLSCKLDLIEHSAALGKILFSSMGMAQKLDPAQIKTAGIWETKGCALARLVRQGLRGRGFDGTFTVVYSAENIPRQTDFQEGGAPVCGSGACLCPANGHEWCSSKKIINGSAVPVTATAGMILASLVIRDTLKTVAA